MPQRSKSKGSVMAGWGWKLAVETQTITVSQPRDASINCLTASRSSPLCEAIPMLIREGGMGSPAQTPARGLGGPRGPLSKTPTLPLRLR